MFFLKKWFLKFSCLSSFFTYKAPSEPISIELLTPLEQQRQKIEKALKENSRDLLSLKKHYFEMILEKDKTIKEKIKNDNNYQHWLKHGDSLAHRYIINLIKQNPSKNEAIITLEDKCNNQFLSFNDPHMVIHSHKKPLKWDWKLTNTYRVPGIKKSELSLFLNHYKTLDYIILSTGITTPNSSINGWLNITEDAHNYLKELKEKKEIKDFFILPTLEVAEKYTHLLKNDPGCHIAAFMHLEE